jgi:hypothetical protein
VRPNLVNVLDSAFDIVASCCDGVKSLRAIQDLSPDVALVDSTMPLVSASKFWLPRDLKGPHQNTPHCGYGGEGSIVARSMGSHGVIPTDVQPEALVRYLRQVATGLRLRTDAFGPHQKRILSKQLLPKQFASDSDRARASNCELGV